MTDKLNIETVAIDSLNPDPANVRKHDERNVDAIKASLAKFGQRKPIVVGADDVVQAGNATLAAARTLGWTEIAVVRSPLKGAEAVAYGVADNRLSELAAWDDGLAEVLAGLQKDEGLDHLVTGFTDAEIDALIAGDTEPRGESTHRAFLADRFGVPPFSVLDARQGYWQERKRAWLALGIQSEIGRGGGAADETGTGNGAGSKLLPQAFKQTLKREKDMLKRTGDYSSRGQ